MDNNDSNNTGVSGCTTQSFDDFETSAGQWIDGGSDVLRLLSASFANSGAYSMRLRDNSSTASAITKSNVNIAQNGSTFISFSFLPESMESGEDFFLEIGSGTNFTTIGRWISGQDFQNGVRQQVRVDLSTFTNATRTDVRIRCDASSNFDLVYIDDILIETCIESAPTCQVGQPCNDGDSCTQGDVLDAACNCISGVEVDNDRDGHCAAEDQDDNNPCVPDASNCGTTGCNTLDNQDFESSLGIWNDGGGDAFLGTFTLESNSGVRSVRLRDNSGLASSIFTDVLNFSNASSVEVKFNFHPSSMETGEDLILEVSNDGGASFSTIRSWVSGTDFQNNVPELADENIARNLLSSRTVIRIRCDASSNFDRVYIDDIQISVCGNTFTETKPTQRRNSHSGLTEETVVISNQGSKSLSETELFYNLYPNPSADYINLNTNDETAQAVILDSNGKRLSNLLLNRPQEIAQLESGVYFIVIKSSVKNQTLKFVKI